MPSELDSLSRRLTESASVHGAVLFGVADLISARTKELGELPDITSGYPRAISIGVALAPKIVETCIDAPTRLYAFHYRVANTRLDAITFILSQILYTAGYSALPIPASQITDWEKMTGSLSHRLVGSIAGLGFIGRSRLLVNPQYGARLRLATLLTDALLLPDAPYSGAGCGDCRLCVAVCPASAIGETPEEHNLKACRAKLDYFQRHLVGQHICGVCVRVCAGGGG
jgi:epoxyqueuosine reductase QueG